MPNAESQSEILVDATTSGRRNAVDPELLDLFVFEAGSRIFAVPADQVDGTTEARDPTVLLTGQSLRWPRTLPCVIALRGDEQLALVAQSYRDKITIEEADLDRQSESGADATGLLLGRVRYAGEEILVLDVRHLFASVMRQRERRRRRF